MKGENKAKGGVAKWVGVAVIAFVLGAGAVFAFTIPGLGNGEKVKPVNGTVTMPLAKVSDGKAHFYRFDDSGKEIRFFLARGSDGVVHTAFDACDVCFHEKKGYERQGDFMVCKNCNRKFAVNMIGSAAGGGCNPSYLPNTVQGNRIVIKAEDLKSGARFF